MLINIIFISLCFLLGFSKKAAAMPKKIKDIFTRDDIQRENNAHDILSDNFLIDDISNIICEYIHPPNLMEISDHELQLLELGFTRDYYFYTEDSTSAEVIYRKTIKIDELTDPFELFVKHRNRIGINGCLFGPKLVSKKIFDMETKFETVIIEYVTMLVLKRGFFRKSLAKNHVVEERGI